MEATAASVVDVSQPQVVSAQIVGNAFVQQYYHILHHSPGLVHRFYQDISKLGRPGEDGAMSITTTMQAINEKIVSLNYGDFRAVIKSVDAQESFDGGFQVLVTGYLTAKDNTVQNFAQAFFLAPQDKGYFVLNDIFRFVEDVNGNTLVTDDVALPVRIEQNSASIEENHDSEEKIPPAEENVTGEVYNPPENGDVPILEDDPVAEVVDEVQDESHLVVESNTKFEEMPKKSYASIVMNLKESAATFSPPVSAPRKSSAIKVEHPNPSFVPAAEAPVSRLESMTDNGNNQEADGYSVYIKGLPMNATESLLEEVFTKFGTIKIDGIQVRSNRQQGFCFGFVEFEEASSMQKALEASPVTIGGRHSFVEEKKSTNSSRVNNRGRFQSGRGSGFRNDGFRGRGNYGGGRGGYNRSDFNGRGDFNVRSDFGNWGSNRGVGSSNHDGYQRSDNVNRVRMNRSAGFTNENSKSMTPRFLPQLEGP